MISLLFGEPQKKKIEGMGYGSLKILTLVQGFQSDILKTWTQGQRLPSSPSSPYLVPVLASIIQVLILDAFCMEYLSKLVFEKKVLI